ncbi:MAG: zinc ribbon domain-containing protein, partial [Deltaproteobacteria bacterium]|nr:zinc ribbon domain-containing protein [Deltaproteobacteria bacterium]
MPIYEFYCPDCHMIFNFFSQRINTEKVPGCPKCGRSALERQMSTFSISRGLTESDDDMMPDLDEAKMEKAMELMARETNSLDEDDPRQAARLMEKMTEITGMEFGPEMKEALKRLEAGEDPDEIEAEMGDLLDTEDPMSLFAKKKSGGKSMPPRKD